MQKSSFPHQAEGPISTNLPSRLKRRWGGRSDARLDGRSGSRGGWLFGVWWGDATLRLAYRHSGAHFALDSAIRHTTTGAEIVPNHSALAVANEIIKRRQSGISPNQTQLQKLVFNCHAWNLAVNGAPLIGERAQAWDNGPVYRSIWNHIRDYGHHGTNRLLVDPQAKTPFSAQFSPAEIDVIRRTFDKYNPLSGLELSRMAHEPGSPWEKAYFGRGRNSSLSDADIRPYYVKLALAGRA